MARPAICVYQGAALALRPGPHPCPFCRIRIPGAKAACTPCGTCLPKPLRDALARAWDEGRGRDSGGFAAALEAAKEYRS